MLDDLFLIMTASHELFEVKGRLEKQGVSCKEANIEMVPKVCVACDESTSQANLALIEWLESIDDVDLVFWPVLQNFCHAPPVVQVDVHSPVLAVNVSKLLAVKASGVAEVAWS